MGMRKKYIVELSLEDRESLLRLIAAGAAPARKLAHARILLKADEGSGGPGCPDADIVECGGDEPADRLPAAQAVC